MIFGSLHIDREAVHTHRDSYVLDALTVFSVRRPFLPMGGMIAVGLMCFGLAFFDLLFAHELLIIAGVSAASLWIGWTVGQLQLLSRDLKGSELSGAIYGTYHHLNAARREIASAKRSRRAEVSS
jgi:hypothetical protein